MRNDFDIEDVLKKYRHAPEGQVKQSVLARFAERIRRRRRPGRRMARIWQKPVPLYLAAAQIVIALSLGFFASRILAPAKTGLGTGREQPREIEAGTHSPDAVELDELTWEVAPNDIL